MRKDILISQLQIENDELSYHIVTTERDLMLYSTFQSFCNFNVMHTLFVLRWYKDVISFINRNGKELKRKFELAEFQDFARLYRIKAMRFKIDTFADYKKIKVKPFKK